MPHLGTQGGNESYAAAINAAGQVVGTAQTDTSIPGRFSGIGCRRDRPGHLEAGDDATSVAIGINDLGQVVGYTDIDAGIVEHAFLWTQAGGMQDLGSLGNGSANRSEAWGVNNGGQVVGRTGTSAGVRGFVWTEAGGMVDLNTLVPPGTTQVLVIAQGINDSGEIVGTSLTFRALLLTPVH